MLFTLTVLRSRENLLRFKWLGKKFTFEIPNATEVLRCSLLHLSAAHFHLIGYIISASAKSIT